jgi:hypothetical protein
MTRRFRLLGRALAAGTLVAVALLVPREAAAATYYYVNWTEADVAAGTARGIIALPGGSTVTVTFAAVTEDGGMGNLYGAQVNGVGTNYWTPEATFISKEVNNPPPTPDIIQLSGGENETYKVTLSQPIEDPIMAIVSLGAAGVTITYDFDSPFTIVSQGMDLWGGSSTSLVKLPNNVLQGTEGSGTIQFTGTFSTFSWTVPTPETWHGFTFGIRTTEALAEAEAGAGDAATDAASDGGRMCPGGYSCSTSGSSSVTGLLPALYFLMIIGLMKRRYGMCRRI